MKLSIKPILILASSFLLSGCTLPFISGKAGIQVASNPQGTVFIDNQNVGKTLVYQDNSKAGSHTVKIVPLDTTYQPWEGKVELTPGTLTVIERQLAITADQASGYILSFAKIKSKDQSEINVVSLPNTVSVLVDGAPAGFSPLSLDSVSPGAHTFTFTAPGYQEKTVKANVQSGYKLLITVQLASQQVETPTPTATPSSTLITPTPSISITPTSTATSAAVITPLPRQASGSATTAKPYVEILTTPTGWLKVRSDSNPNAIELAKVNPGDKFPYVSTTGSWYQIEYVVGQKGWVSTQYSKLVK